MKAGYRKTKSKGQRSHLATAKKRAGTHRKAPRTKAGKDAKVGKVMGEFKRGTLRSSSGQKVTNPKQAKAIAMSESGQARKKRKS